DGMVVRVTGKVSGEGAKAYLANPNIDRTPVEPGELHQNLFVPDSDAPEEGLFPVYSESRGVSSLWFQHAVKRVLATGIAEKLPDPIPPDIRTKFNLPTLATALVWIHLPR